MTKTDTDRQEVDRSMDTVDGLIHTDRRTDRQSERVNSNSDRLVRRCGWVEEEERMRKAKGRRRKGDDLLEEAAASLIFIGTKAALLCCRDDWLLALRTVDG